MYRGLRSPPPVQWQRRPVMSDSRSCHAIVSRDALSHRYTCLLGILQVLRYGSLSAIVAHPAEASVRDPSSLTESSTPALLDALECLTAIAVASDDGRTVLLESGGVAAAAAALEVRS